MKKKIQSPKETFNFPPSYWKLNKWSLMKWLIQVIKTVPLLKGWFSAFPSIFIMLKLGDLKGLWLILRVLMRLRRIICLIWGIILKIMGCKALWCWSLLNYIFHGYREGRKPNLHLMGIFIKKPIEMLKIHK